MLPHLFAWDDNRQDNAFWRDALTAAGCDVTWIDLSERGITGNSHVLMADTNSDAIATVVLDGRSRAG